MHRFELPPEFVDRVTKRQGRPHTCETFEPTKTALVVVDMQNYYMAAGQQAACPVAQRIVPNVNRLAETVRRTGGIVIWLQNLVPRESLKSWSVVHERFREDARIVRMESLQPDAWPFQLWPQLETRPEDFRVTKRRYSAFIPGSSDIELVLREHGIDTILVTGVATNVCCDSTARDAMMMNYRSVMVSDGCAAVTDEEHASALCNFYLHFGDVQSTSELCARLQKERQDAGVRRAWPAMTSAQDR